METVIRSDKLSSGLLDIVYIESYIDSKKIIENHCHLKYEIIIIKNGESDVIIEGKHYTLNANSMILILPLVYHCVIPKSNSEYKRYTILFDSKLLNNNILSLLINETKINPIIEKKYIADIIQTLDGAYQMEDEKKVLPLIESITVVLSYKYLLRKKTNIISKDSETNKRLEKIINYINVNLTNQITTKDIANEMFLSESAINHMFKKVMNVSIGQYILEKKMILAEDLIANGTPPTKAAVHIGYPNYSNFYKMYVKYFKHSPSKK